MKVSIITPTYNRGNTIENTILSILEQTYNNIEYIIIDGKSTDNSISIIKTYETMFNGRLIWISQPDKGLYDALNKGIRMATGDIIGILHSDDFFTQKNIIEKIVHTFQKDEGYDAVYGDVHYVNPNNLNKCIRYYSSRIFRPSLMRLGFIPAHPTFYMKKGCYQQFNGYKTDYKIAADYEFLLRVIYKGNIQTKYIPIDMVTMRIKGLSTSGWKSHLIIMREHLRACRENKIYTNIFILSLRYFYKIYELIYYKLSDFFKTRQ